ncbi:hypothetical protein [Sphingomonas sp. PP-CE-1G-424]|uniref:hypothetical protein n=1 Tax=Sphingomonas sp. PP-CE-1G-424 TaxID=2135658 RepID=UPI0010550C7A|nr:hypothetical protein [Sphingomonas sp. PP-CE-1G-424]
MPALTPNIENRVRKLPKPSNATQSLQPLFEAVSNAMFAIEDAYGDYVSKGRIDITVSKLSDADGIQIMIADDVLRLDARDAARPRGTKCRCSPPADTGRQGPAPPSAR